MLFLSLLLRSNVLGVWLDEGGRDKLNTIRR